jgi:hypothetical protein
MAKTLAASAALLILTASFAQAAVRNYFAPVVDGQRLDSCLTGESDCGKPAADAFCKVQGFEVALMFQREAAADTKRLGNGVSCAGPSCTSFKQIKCYSPGDTVASAQS